MSIFNDHLNLVDVKYLLDDTLKCASSNPIKIKYIIINKSFTNKEIVLKYFPLVQFKYIEDIDSNYEKYIKYKNKYLQLKYNNCTMLYNHSGGTKYIKDMKQSYEIINKYFQDKDICTIDDIIVNNIMILSDIHGITKGYGGGYLLSGTIDKIDCVFKLFKIYETKEIPDKNINEIGLTHYVSDYFLNHVNEKITDNFVTFFHMKRCMNFLIQDYPLSTLISEQISIKDKTTDDVNIMIVEKVIGDLRGFLESFLTKNTEPLSHEKKIETIEFLDSILFQIIYTLYVFDKEFKGFIHGDLHLGNILIKTEKNKTKKYKIIRYLDDDPIDFNIEVKTFGVTPALWDFATSYIHTINEKIIDNNKDILDKYFGYRKTNKLIQYNKHIINTDLSFLLNSIKLLTLKYHIPIEYINELEEIFTGKTILRIFNIFLQKISEKYENNDITHTSCDYYYHE